MVTRFEYRLHEVGPMINLGLFFFGLEQGAEALRLARDFIPALQGDDHTGFLAIAMSAPPAPFVPAEYHFKPGHAILVVGFGSPEEHAAAVAPIREALAPLFELVTPMPYVALQQMFNESAEWGTLGYEKGLYLDRLSDEVIAVIGEHAPRKTFPTSFCPTFTLDGAYSRVGDDETAWGGGRAPALMINIAGHATTPEVHAAEREWVRDFWAALRPHAAGSGGYINFMVEQDEDRIRATYGAKYDRLSAVKREYDPENVFHLNANIKPA